MAQDLIAAAEHLLSNLSATFQEPANELPGAVNGSVSPMEFVESPELFPTVHEIDAMDAKDSSERMHYFALDWEMYYLLFASNCIWLILQAVAAAARAAHMDRTFALTAFFEGTVTGTFPLIADAYDTLKDVLVGALCLHSDSALLKVIGVASWVYLAAIHVVFLGWFPLVKEMVKAQERWWIEELVGVDFLSEEMGDRFCLEMLASYAPILLFPTALKQGDEGGALDGAEPSCLWKMWSRLSNFLSGMVDALVGFAYKQVTPVKRSLLAIENIFQGMVGIAYMVIEGGSIFVGVLNVAVPILQILFAVLFHKPLRRKAAPWLAKRLKLALEDGDLVVGTLIREEAFETLEIFSAVAPHLVGYDGFTALVLDFEAHGIDEEGAEKLRMALQQLQQLQVLWLWLDDNVLGDDGAMELAAVLEQLQQLTALDLFLQRNDIEDEGVTALAEAVQQLPRLVVVALEGNDFGRDGEAAWLRLEKELRSRGAKVRIFLDD
eukprot:Skav202789  [mRNA]  locus=scaffold326:610701:614134:+ [translate_table: standard]